MVAACVCALGCAVATAAAPVRGATYHGSLLGSRSAIKVSFRVSAGGTQVSAITVTTLPLYCKGQPPPGARIRFQNAKVDSRGTFTAAGSDRISAGPLKGSEIARLSLTGTFGANGTAAGVITTTFQGSGGARCSGHSPYRAKT
jgi:hypothetical protein